MGQKHWLVICLAYIVGLLSTFLLREQTFGWQWLTPIGSLGILTTLSAFVIPQKWPRGPQPAFYLLMGLVALTAAIYFQFRLPQPQKNDISQVLTQTSFPRKVVTVRGELISEGKTNAQGRVQFWLNTELVQARKNGDFQPVTGKLYLTLPNEAGENLITCQKVQVTGALYRPKAASNPGAMDFKQYLASQGVFAGLKGYNAKTVGSGFCLLSQLRQRIVTIQGAWLPKNEQGKSLEGLLLSSIVLGSKAVNLPYATRTLFNQVGLAHVLAASGFQVSLLVGTVLQFGQGLSKKTRFILGLAVLLLYLGLTGFQPSVTRAGVMWFAILIGELSDRRVNSLGSLLVAVTVLLLIMPIWIWDLGFQLSVLATLGIIVTAPYLEKSFNFLPPKIANFIAIPLAASLWTLPLLLSQFSVLVLYAIPLNILVTPLIEVISFGGMISAITGLIVPPIGSAIAWLLYFPTHWLTQIAGFFSQFPTFSPGKMPLGILILIYGGMVLVWLNSWWQKRWPIVGTAMIGLMIFPLILQHFTLTKVTVFDTPKFPAIAIQRRTQVTLIDHGDRATRQFTLAPFLAQEAVNQLECALNLAPSINNPEESQVNLLPTIKNQRFLDSDTAQSCAGTQLLNLDPPLLQLTLPQQNWWFIPEANRPLPQLSGSFSPTVLIWQGKTLDPTWITTFPVKTAIAISRSVDRKTRNLLEKQGIQLYVTGIDGAIQWTPQQGFQTILDSTDGNLS
ncbi:MAG: ComEC/Rec2 family competence protein [Snowella sp.]|nr:ComEC/Rec2 family competence protein [Snowella sp.]